ncbi:hypothetical protein FD754_020511, partial [Muntiacus muntjak]
PSSTSCCKYKRQYRSSDTVAMLEILYRMLRVKQNKELKSYGIQDIFVFCTRGELSKYRVPNLLDLYHQCGIITHHHPIPDGGTPDITSCCEIMEELEICLKNNRKTLIHCYGGLGRSCLVAACLLLYLSDTVSPQQAIDSLRDLRGSGAIQTIKVSFHFNPKEKQCQRMFKLPYNCTHLILQ